MTLIEALKRITTAAEDHPALREAIVALVDTAAERVMDEVKDESPPEGFDEGVMTLAAAVAAHLGVGIVERRRK
jgi:adenine/guanine phosphoribosyltransferase-like PRPP-binding protein